MTAVNIRDLLSPGAIAKAVGASDARVKKALKDLKIAPTTTKGVCSYCGPDVVPRVKAAVVK